MAHFLTLKSQVASTDPRRADGLTTEVLCAPGNIIIYQAPLDLSRPSLQGVIWDNLCFLVSQTGGSVRVVQEHGRLLRVLGAGQLLNSGWWRVERRMSEFFL